MYELRYVAFIDLLGFKSKVYNSILDKNEFDRIQKVLGYIYNLKKEDDQNLYSPKYIGKEFSMFSDSIVISYPANGYGNAFNILLDIAHICLDILSFGYILRGGIAMDCLYHKDAVCFGPAMNMAVEMENKAKYPRIIIDQNVLSNGLRYPGIANSTSQEKDFLDTLVKQDQWSIGNNSHPIYILDYLSLYDEFADLSSYIKLMGKTRNFIITEFGNTFSINDLDKRKNIQEKYVWFANYYNDTIRNIIPTYYEQYKIKFD